MYYQIEGDHIAYRYEILEYVTEGAHGQVIKCRDHKTRQIVAIKVVINAYKFVHTTVWNPMDQVDNIFTKNLVTSDPHKYNLLWQTFKSWDGGGCQVQV